MGKNESQARNDKVSREVKQKVLKSFGDVNPSKAAKDLAKREDAAAKRGDRTTVRRR